MDNATCFIMYRGKDVYLNFADRKCCRKDAGLISEFYESEKAKPSLI